MKTVKFKTNRIIGTVSTLIILTLAVIASNPVFAEQVIVSDITQGEKIVFTTGDSLFYGVSGCRYGWGGLKKYSFEGFMQGDSSYSLNIRTNSNGRECVSIKTDVVDKKITIPYVNIDAFNSSLQPPILTSAMVVTASTPTIGTIFRLSENPYEKGTTNIEAGIYGTLGYFICEIGTNSLMLQWLKSAGIEKEITPGYVFSMTWVSSHKHCYKPKMVFDPQLVQSAVPIDSLPKCPVNCIP